MLALERNQRNHEDVVQLLLKKVADVKIKDIKGDNELMIAKEKENSIIIELPPKYGLF